MSGLTFRSISIALLLCLFVSCIGNGGSKYSREERVMTRGHDTLSTWGSLSDFDGRAVRDWVEQLVSQGFMEKRGEYNVLHVTERGHDVLAGDETPVLLKPAAE